MVLLIDLPSTNLFALSETPTGDGNGIPEIEPASGTSLVPLVSPNDQEPLRFSDLPREIRDFIYLDLVVATDPIQYEARFETLCRSNTFAHTALMWTFEHGSNSQIAQEARESFYRHNTFLIYIHDIPILLGAKAHEMSFAGVEGAEPTVYSTPFEAAAWVRKLAVRVGWHASGRFLPDACCLGPAHDLNKLLRWDSLQSVIIDASFGSWPYGYPEGIEGSLLGMMNEKWGGNFRIYNDGNLRTDTRRYTSDRWDLSNRWTLYGETDEEVEKSENVPESGTGNEEAALGQTSDTETLVKGEDEDEDQDQEEEDKEYEEEDNEEAEESTGEGVAYEATTEEEEGGISYESENTAWCEEDLGCEKGNTLSW